MGYVVSFLAGAVVSCVMLMLALNYYVDISHPYLVWGASMFVCSACVSLVRSKNISSSLARAALAFSARSAAFALGAAASFYGLLAIYPPNL